MDEKKDTKFFEREDQWSYKLLLQELYRNCILSLHDVAVFILCVEKFYVAISNFPELPLKDIIDKKSASIDDEYNEAHDSIEEAYDNHERDYCTMPMRARVLRDNRQSSILYQYHRQLFYIIRDVLAEYGAFTRVKESKEQGFQL